MKSDLFDDSTMMPITNVGFEKMKMISGAKDKLFERCYRFLPPTYFSLQYVTREDSNSYEI